MGKATWMAGNYGIMVHFLSHIAPRSGSKKMTVDQMADQFDVKKFVCSVKQMGGKWIIFPFGQNTGHYWSYNAVIEKYHPGSCSKRDLVLELAVEAKQQGLRFIGYFPTEVDGNTPAIRDAFGWDLSADKKVFMERWTQVIRYYAEKFGTLLDGWWFDGCFNAAEKTYLRTNDWDNRRFDEESWFAAARAGNPDRITAMNKGSNRVEYVFEQEEYLPGESAGPDQKLIEKHLGGRTDHLYPWDYASREKQWHTLIWLDCFWMHCGEPGEIEPPRFSDETLFDYAKTCLDKKGGITWNVGIYEDSSLAEKTVAQIVRLKEMLEK